MLSNFNTFSHRNWSKCVTSSKTVLLQWYLGVGQPQQFSLCAAPNAAACSPPPPSAAAAICRRRLPGKLLFSRETDFVPLCFFGNLKSASTAYFQNTKHLCQYIHDTVYHILFDTYFLLNTLYLILKKQASFIFLTDSKTKNSEFSRFFNY